MTQAEWAHHIGLICARDELTDPEAIGRMIARLPAALKRMQKMMRGLPPIKLEN